MKLAPAKLDAVRLLVVMSPLVVERLPLPKIIPPLITTLPSRFLNKLFSDDSAMKTKETPLRDILEPPEELDITVSLESEPAE